MVAHPLNNTKKILDKDKQERILLRHFFYGTLSGHKHTHVVELCEHSQRTVGQHDLFRRNLRRGRCTQRSDTHRTGVRRMRPTLRSLTSTSRRWDSCSALVCLIQLPALVTNTTGTLYLPLRSTRFLKHCLAPGMGVLPRTSTPSMSKRSPKEPGPYRRAITLFIEWFIDFF